MINFFNKLLLIYLSIFALVQSSTNNNGLKIVIDNDAGGDDAMAIFITLLYEKHHGGPQLVALTTGNGNTKEDNVSKNNQRVLNVAGRQDVPIYRGVKSSLTVTPTVHNYYGVDGLGDTGENVTYSHPVEAQNAVLRLIELSKTYEGDLIVVTLGTLTNIALAVKLDPAFLNRLNHLYVAAGHIQSELYPAAEFNAQMDPEAYHIVAEHANPDKVTIIPFSQCLTTLNLTKEWRMNVLGSFDTDIIREQNKFERVSLGRPGDIWSALDPAALSVAVNPSLVQEYKYSKNDIVLCGNDRGINTNEIVAKDQANVRVVYTFKNEEYKKFLLDVFKHEN